MGAGRKTQTFTLLSEKTVPPSSNSSTSARNLRKCDLGGVIFGCKHATMKECLSNQLFGLPSLHFSYVRNIEPGLPLFLFNYSDRKLYGIFEAASHGQMNINPYAWTADGSERTQFPAQVHIRIQMQCKPLLEDRFKPVIADNFYTPNHFWFELDHQQTRCLATLFQSSPVATFPYNISSKSTVWKDSPSPSMRLEDENCRTQVPEVNAWHSDSKELGSFLDENNDEYLVYRKLQQLALDREHEKNSSKDQAEDIAGPCLMNDTQSEDDSLVSVEKTEEVLNQSSDCQSTIAQLLQRMEELNSLSLKQCQRTSALEKKLADSYIQIELLKERVKHLESSVCPSLTHFEPPNESRDHETISLDPDELIFLVGGRDGISWLSALDSYSTSQDVMKSLRPMSSVRAYASAAALNGDLYIFGGGNGSSWYNTVESYNPLSNEWTIRPPLLERKGSLAGATLNNKLYACGGGNGLSIFSEVEMFDPALGRWVPTRSMLNKRFATAAVELNGVLYAVGGFDGNDYLKSAEKFDPREVSWARIPSMNVRRGCHSLAVLNDKIYALGGYEGTTMVPSVEIFDPRMGSWMIGDPMNESRGFSAAVVVQGSIFVIGGLNDGHVQTVECYKEGHGWQVTNLKAIGQRSSFAAIVL